MKNWDELSDEEKQITHDAYNKVADALRLTGEIRDMLYAQVCNETDPSTRMDEFMALMPPTNEINEKWLEPLEALSQFIDQFSMLISLATLKKFKDEGQLGVIVMQTKPEAEIETIENFQMPEKGDPRLN